MFFNVSNSGRNAFKLNFTTKEQNALDRYNDVLDEMPRVRKKIWVTPPLVTPTSQIVGIQAVMNVLGGERYKKFLMK